MGDGFVLSSTRHEVFYLQLCVGEFDRHACCCMCASRQISAYLNKHTQTNVISLETGFWFTMWASVCIGFTVNGCYVHRYLFLMKILVTLTVISYHIVFTFSDLLSSSVSLSLFTPLLTEAPVWNQTCLLSKTFFSGGTTIRAAPLPPCPCAALKGIPSWRLSWWWGSSVYYWACCSLNSLP